MTSAADLMQSLAADESSSTGGCSIFKTQHDKHLAWDCSVKTEELAHADSQAVP